MQEARFKIKYNAMGFKQWESIPFIPIVVNSSGLASKIAAGMALVPGVYEVRWNMAGSQQGHYVAGSKA